MVYAGLQAEFYLEELQIDAPPLVQKLKKRKLRAHTVPARQNRRMAHGLSAEACSLAGADA
jgi:hypothetical protein